MFTSINEGIHDGNSLQELKQFMHKLYQDSYFFSEDKLKTSFESRLAYNHALLAQRVIYYYEYSQDLAYPAGHEENLQASQAYVREVYEQLNGSKQSYQVLAARGEQLLEEITTGGNSVLLYSVISQIVYILNLVLADKKVHWQLPKKTLAKLYQNLNKHSLKEFELRAAIRISVIFTLAFLLVALLQIDRAIWLPANIFVLVRPFNEDSSYRSKNRLIGILIGGAICLMLLPVLSGVLMHLILAGILGIFVFTLVAGTVTQAAVSTVFSLVLASLSMVGTVQVVELRVVFVIAAIVLVYVVNRFLTPIDEQLVFQNSLFNLFDIHLNYLTLIEKRVIANTPYNELADVQVTASLLHLDLKKYTQNLQNADQELAELLNISWQMIAVAEQIFAKSERITHNDDVQNLLAWIQNCQRNILQAKLLVNAEGAIPVMSVVGKWSNDEKMSDVKLLVLMQQYTDYIAQIYTKMKEINVVS